jgi:hypothetical protein
MAQTYMVVAYLDQFDFVFDKELAVQARGDKKQPGFNNATMLLLLKMWTKIVLGLDGPKRSPADYAKHVPNPEPPPSISRYKWAQLAVERLKDQLSRQTEAELSSKDSSARSGQMYMDADGAMMDLFFLRYLESQEFIRLLTAWANQSADSQMAQMQFKMDQSL